MSLQIIKSCTFFIRSRCWTVLLLLFEHLIASHLRLQRDTRVGIQTHGGEEGVIASTVDREAWRGQCWCGILKGEL
jgi:hypothetical protein